MKVLGISGLHNSVDFKRRELPDLSAREYRVVQGLDSAAALVVDGVVRAAAAEERYTAEKATGSFPAHAIRDALRRTGVTPDEIDVVAHGFAHRSADLDLSDPYLAARYAEVYDPDVQLTWLRREFPSVDWAAKLVPVPHHLAHAASAYYPSGYDEALVLVADGMGETESLTVAAGTGGKLEVLHRIPALHSIGTLYGVFTMYLGFDMMMDEYKVMGLAAFGDRRVHYAEMSKLVKLLDGGTFTVSALAADRNLRERETHRGVLALLAERFGPPRQPGTPIEQRHRDVAAALQAVVELCLVHVLRHFRRETGLRDLCYAGGVALNCSANGVIARSRLFERIFIPPGAGDDGSAVGAALYVQAQQEPSTRIPAMSMPYWGTSYTDEEIGAAVGSRTDVVVRHVPERARLLAETAEALEAGEVVSWFQGGMEFGPRALGNRSILADPREARMRDHINALIKRREDFRPFAPVVTEEAASTYFEIEPGDEERFRHMLFTTRTRSEHRDSLGAVTHFDGTARVQVVTREGNPLLWELLTAFADRTGIPVLLNTSFNLRGQPIVRTPEIAVDTLLRGGLSRLVIGAYTVTPPDAGGDRP
ncbi:carbamoyltransferase C-terminal domain-containing protein [Verrucosispora sp. NA02020]|uniref:carbamoyltransferase family protein n=1 Tax=unclassified Micromonospora TaxID=2617518 RepID=UPI00159074F9|nr:carbamoyltransferase C-terminal domain-containing protein [Verrucosispora sp. NA02020]QKW12436.1 carbamoyltransferase [Verrucosispora sp. NA02020]